ncbi:hypothetical protein PMAYCL1PPCAC_14219, partial [Pristionchus mayeri]
MEKNKWLFLGLFHNSRRSIRDLMLHQWKVVQWLFFRFFRRRNKGTATYTSLLCVYEKDSMPQSHRRRHPAC